MRYVAEQLRGNRYVVRPAGVCGTCGWIDGKPWTAFFVTARSPAAALLKFHCSGNGNEPIAGKPLPA